MQRESQVPLDIDNFLVDNGSPLILQFENTKFMKSKTMKKTLRKERTKKTLTKPNFQNQNIAKRIVQIEKHFMHRLMA